MLLLPLWLALAPSIAGALQDDELGPGELVEGELAFQLDEFLTRLEGLGFSGVVGVEDEGQPILIRGYGPADREAGLACTPATVFDLGSITKQFTAAAILALQDEGRLAVSDPLAKHLPGVPVDKAALTLHHLLTHTSGLPDPPRGDHDLTATAEWVRTWVLAQPLESAPGERHDYRNVNYSLLGMVLERVSGEGYEAFLRRRLFERAGMTRTGYLLPRFAEHELAVGYLDGDRWGTTLGRPLLPDGPAWTLRANGGLHATVGDVLRWHHALLDERVLSAAAREQLVTPFADEGGGTSYAYGWSIATSPGGKRLVAHNGGNGVYFADLLRCVDEGRCVFVATTVGCRFRGTLAYDLLAILYGRPVRALPETLPRGRDSLAGYVGRFPLGAGAALRVENQGDRLVLSGQGEEALELLCDERARPCLERGREAVAAFCAGDDDALVALHAGRASASEVRAELSAARARWNERLGAFRALGTPSLRSGREITVACEARFERGSAFVRLAFGPGNRVLGCEYLDVAPFPDAARLELFPLSTGEFRVYDERTADARSVHFELDAAGRVEALRMGEIELARE